MSKQTPNEKAPETKVADVQVTQATKGQSPSEAAGLVKGKTYRFVAVHGDICHYSDGTRFSTDDSVKHEADDWAIIQFDAGKLRLGE